MITVEVFTNKIILTLMSLCLLLYLGEMMTILAVTRLMRQDVLEVGPSKLLEVTERPAEKYKLYLNRFGKNYSNEEELKRFEIFKDSLKKIAYLNRDPSARYGLTKFSDVSDEERFPKPLRLGDCEEMKRYCWLDDVNAFFKDDLCTNSHDGEEMPESFDWRSQGVVGPVLDQKLCNGCWAFGIAGVVESMAAIRKYEKGVRRSIQYLLDCDDYSDGCRGGNVGHALKWLCDYKKGIVTEDIYPLTLVKSSCKMNDTRPIRRVKQFCQLCNVNESDIPRFVYFHGPVLAVVNARTWTNYIDGIIQMACVRYNVPSAYVHVVQIVGYDLKSDIPHYIIRNSWGEDFGNEGYVKLGIGNNVCGIADRITFLDVYGN